MTCSTASMTELACFLLKGLTGKVPVQQCCASSPVVRHPVSRAGCKIWLHGAQVLLGEHLAPVQLLVQAHC